MVSKTIEQQRRADAHEKIQLGALVAKAGLRECDAAILLGAMLEVSQALANGETHKVSRWRELGFSAFNADATKNVAGGREDG